MTFKEILIDLRKKTNSAYLSFLLQYKKDDDSVHLFYEGYGDYSFYTNYINSKYKIGKYTYSCDGKRRLHHIYKTIDWTHFDRNRVLFFTDKDYSDILNEKWDVADNIFVTKYYAIENYLINKAMLKRCIVENINIDKNYLIEEICDLYSKALNDFLVLSNLVTGWIIFMKTRENITLSEIDISDFFSITDDLEFKINRREKKIKYFYRRIQPSTKLPCASDVRRIIGQLMTMPCYKIYTRGKFEMSFFVEFVKMIPEMLNKGRKAGEKKFVSNFILTVENSISFLGPRLPIPDDVQAFLDKF